MADHNPQALRARTAQSWARRVHLIDLLIASVAWTERNQFMVDISIVNGGYKP